MEFLKNDTKHTTQLWPQANGKAERTNRTLLDVIKIGHAEKKEIWEKNKFQIAYRSSPHQTTGVTPAELIFKQKTRTKLLELNSINRSQPNESISDLNLIYNWFGHFIYFVCFLGVFYGLSTFCGLLKTETFWIVKFIFSLQVNFLEIMIFSRYLTYYLTYS